MLRLGSKPLKLFRSTFVVNYYSFLSFFSKDKHYTVRLLYLIIDMASVMQPIDRGSRAAACLTLQLQTAVSFEDEVFRRDLGEEEFECTWFPFSFIILRNRHPCWWPYQHQAAAAASQYDQHEFTGHLLFCFRFSLDGVSPLLWKDTGDFWKKIGIKFRKEFLSYKIF